MEEVEEEKEVIREYDGIIETKKGPIVGHTLNIYDALNQSNPRNVFLNGQLYIENFCDTILIFYHCGDDGMKQNSLSQFLSSRHIDFFGKIQWLKLLEKAEEVKEGNVIKRRRSNLIPSEIIASLNAIGNVRNAFQHNLIYTDALRNVRGNKFPSLNKVLDDYHDIDELVKDFKSEATDVYLKLHDILMNINH